MFEELTYDDVLLIPNYSENISRSSADISTSCFRHNNKFRFRIPIISANMSTITEADMAISMHKLGGLGILHRFYNDQEKYISDIEKVYSEIGYVAFSIGVNEQDYKLIDFIYDLDLNPSCMIVTVDIAHGHCLKMKNMLLYLYNKGLRNVIAGNVCTSDGATALRDWGASCIKVGVGPGSICSTRIVTGCGYPQLSAISNIRKHTDIPLIADGGIKNSGDIVKAIATGADAVMIGNLFAGSIETPGEIFSDFLGKKFKLYMGMASKEAQLHRGKSIEEDIVPEGIVKSVEFTNTSIKDVVFQLVGGIKSGLSYCGAKNLDELRKKAKFVKISRAAYIEGMPDKA